MICETILNYLQQGVETDISCAWLLIKWQHEHHRLMEKKRKKKTKTTIFAPVHNVSFAKVKKHNLAYITAVGHSAV